MHNKKQGQNSGFEFCPLSGIQKYQYSALLSVGSLGLQPVHDILTGLGLGLVGVRCGGGGAAGKAGDDGVNGGTHQTIAVHLAALPVVEGEAAGFRHGVLRAQHAVAQAVAGEIIVGSIRAVVHHIRVGGGVNGGVGGGGEQLLAGDGLYGHQRAGGKGSHGND